MFEITLHSILEKSYMTNKDSLKHTYRGSKYSVCHHFLVKLKLLEILKTCFELDLKHPNDLDFLISHI